MADKLYTIVNGEPSELDLGTGGSGSLPGIDERVTALETSQAEQDEAIATAQEEAEEAQSIAASKVATVNGYAPDANGNVDVGGIPLGTVLPYTGSDIPAGTLRADGSTYTNMRASFPDFYEWVVSSGLTVALASYTLVEGSCGYYGLDESTGTVRMPTLAAGVFGTTTASQYGQAVAAGLPNITGTLGISNGSATPTGAFAKTTTADWNLAGGGNKVSVYGTFDASRSSAVYGKSNTVTPSHVKYPWVIVVYNAAISASVAETAEFVGLLDGKADKTQVDAIAAYITETWQSGTSWYRTWSDGWVELGGAMTGNNAKWTYPIALTTVFYAQAAGDRQSGDSNVEANKQSFITQASTTWLRFQTDDAENGTTRFYVIGKI